MIFFTESSPQISDRKGCSPGIFSRIISPNLKSQGVSPPKIFPENQIPKSQIARGVSYDFSENQVPSSQNARGVPLRFFRESNLQISIARGVPLEFFENHLPKSQIARGVPLKCFRESSSRISNCKGCRPKILFRESSSQFSSRLLVLLYFGGRRYPDNPT